LSIVPELVISHPPKPRLALAVGVIGHRPNRLQGAEPEVQVRIAEALALIAEVVQAAHSKHPGFFAPEPPALTLVSALAEGADRIVAHVAVERGFALSAVLPFVIEEYEKDFATAASRADYRELLAQSASTTILCGGRDDELRAYEIAGETVLDCSDLVLAVWDGGPSAGRGGTTELLVRASREGLPIVHIDATGTQPTRILWAGLSALALPRADIADVPSAALNKTVEVIEQLVRPPGPSTEVTKLQEFLDASWRPRNWRLEVPLLLALLHLRKPRKADLLPQSPEQLAAQFLELARVASPADAASRPRHAFAALASAFGWADALGDRYAQIFRGAYSLNFTFAALAVFMAAASLIASHVLGLEKWPFVVVEIAFVLIVIVNTAAGRRLDWHGRWLETREVAERFRAGIPLWLLGGKPKSYAPGESTWSGWYVRAHFRALGAHGCIFDEHNRSVIKSAITDIVEEQCRYHAATAARLFKIERRIERIGNSLFGLTLAIATAYLAGVAARIASPEWWPYTVTALTAGLPALGAASYAVRLIGDFEGSAKRSQRSGKTLGVLDEALRQVSPSLPALRSFAHAAADVMLGDVAHWRLASETRQLAIPG
jgi:hypothetical protein